MKLFYHSCDLHIAIQAQFFFQIVQRTLQWHKIILIVRLTCVSLFLLLSIGSPAQQCTLPSRIFLPTADEARFEQFGQAIDVDGEYMVAGSQDNSSQQAYSGKATLYKLNSGNQWEKIAELTPSDPGKYRQFGMNVAISGNSVVVFAREYNDEGVSRGKLYVYEKPATGEWVSATENQIITKPFGPVLQQSSYGQFKLKGNELIVIAGTNGKVYLEVYTKSGGIFSLSQSMMTPPSSNNYYYGDWVLEVGNGFFVIATAQFEHADRSYGVAFVYEKNGSYSTTPAMLKSYEQNPSVWRTFGMSIAITNTTVFVQGLKYNGFEYDQTFYIFEKPSSGWVDAVQSYVLEASGYVYSSPQLVANDNYLFSTGADFRSIIGFKKSPSGWSGATRFTIDDYPAEKSVFGYQLKLNNNHIVAGSPNRFRSTGMSEDVIVDYYAADGAWETNDLAYQQILHSASVNATGDFFGGAFSVYNDQLAITADGDDEHGVNGGVIYVFDTQNQSVTPDQKLYNQEDENFTGFGESIAMGDSLMFVGAPYKDSVLSGGLSKISDIGKVYIYRLTSSGWRYSSQIKGPTISPQVCFGQQVVWSPGYCAVTEFYHGSSESVGRVHIYKENTTTGKFDYLATLDPTTHLRSDFFGKSMVMTDSMMVIGTGNFAPNASYRMSVYIFKKRGEWRNATEDAALTSTDSGWSDRFGASVSMYGDYIVVGAPYSPGFDPRPIPRDYIIPGAAYIYQKPKGGWKGNLTEIAKLTPSDPSDYGTFGSSVAIDHNDIFIGSPNVYNQHNYADKFTNNDNTLIPGKVYHYTKPAGEWITTHQETRKLESFEPEIVDGYGATMFVSDRYLYIGAMLDDTPSGFKTGSVQTMMQLPVIDALPVLCSNQTPLRLYGFPKNGTWSGNGVDQLTNTFSPLVAGPGIHTITYHHSGCETTLQVEVVRDELIVLKESDALQTKCVGANISLKYETNEDPGNYAWYFKKTEGESFSKVDSLKQTIITRNPGYYEVRVKREICPMGTREFRIVDEGTVFVQIENPPLICDTDEMQLFATPTGGKWSGSGISTDGKLNPMGLRDGDFKAWYEITTSLGCRWKDSTLFTIDILKQPGIQYNGEAVCSNKPVILTVTNIDNHSAVGWYEGEGNKLADQNGPILKVREAGMYFATVIKSDCILSTPTIEVVALEDSLFVPNVFTANDDQMNDYMEVRAKDIYDFGFVIFNRYGKKVFETNQTDFKWAAENAPPGVYFWRATYTSCSNKRREQKGWVHIIK